MLSHPLQSIVKLLEINKISVYDKLILNLLEVSKVEGNDFDGNQLSSLQQNDFTGCSGEYLCTWFWKCYQIYRVYIENIDHFVDEEKVEDTNEVARSHRSKDKHVHVYMTIFWRVVDLGR
jgi:hypothetical protein